MKLSIIIPVYNEVNTIQELFKRVESVPLNKEIIIVDDFSTDGTRDVLKLIKKEKEGQNNYVFLYHEKNKGKGAAIRTAQQHVSGDIVIIQDADLEYNPSEYPNLIEPIVNGDADVVYGSRFAGYPRRVLSFRHTLANYFLTFLSNLFTNINLTDMETCYKVFRTDIFKIIPIRANRFDFEPEITAKVAKMGCRIYEVPISYKGRTLEEGKKINWKDGITALWTIIKYGFFSDIDKENPGYSTLVSMSKINFYNRFLFDFIKPFLGQNILEVGSGIGNISKFLFLKARTLYLTDIEDKYLIRLKSLYAHYPQIKVLKYNLEQNPIDAIEKIDTVVCLNVLEHIKDDDHALNEMHDLLQTGGRLLLLVPAHHILYGSIDKAIGHFRRYEKIELIDKLQKAGFIIEKIRFINLPGVLGWFINSRILNRKAVPNFQVNLVHLIRPWLFIERHIKIPFGLSIFVTARKIDKSVLFQTTSKKVHNIHNGSK